MKYIENVDPTFVVVLASFPIIRKKFPNLELGVQEQTKVYSWHLKQEVITQELAFIVIQDFIQEQDVESSKVAYV